MREHKVRGYEPIGHVWWYGTSDVTSIDAKSRIAPLSRFWQCVEDEKLANVGDWIGRKDKNGTEIYEGDVYRQEWKGQVVTGQIVYGDMARYWLEPYPHYQIGVIKISGEVIGNVYQNPELLEAQDGCH